MRCERAPARRLTAALFAAIIGLIGSGCTPELCTRHSECPVGTQCSATAQCERLPDAGADTGDGGVVTPGEPDGGVVIGDLPDSGHDAGAPADAALADAALAADASADFDAAVAAGAPRNAAGIAF